MWNYKEKEKMLINNFTKNIECYLLFYFFILVNVIFVINNGQWVKRNGALIWRAACRGAFLVALRMVRFVSFIVEQML
jgi:hypothetical protein